MTSLLLQFFTGFDNQVLSFFVDARTPLRTLFFFVSTHFADMLVVLCVVFLFVMILRRYYDHAYILSFVLCVSGSALTTWILKNVFDRMRPEASLYAESLFSFPSGHATTALALYGFIALFFALRVRRMWLSIFGSVFFVSLAVVVGISRLYLGVHYATDVIAGFAVAFVWLTLCFFLEKKFFSKRMYWEHYTITRHVS